jgi:predicted permease
MLSDLLYMLRALFRRDAMEVELDEELRDHLDRQAERYRQSGLPPNEAMRRARIDFGGPEQIRQQSRDGRGTRLIEDLLQDASYGVRTLAKSPGFTFVAILTLALGIGASTAIFSLINAVLLRSLPYGNSSRLVYLFTPNPRFDIPAEVFGPSNADFFDLKNQSKSFSDMTIFNQANYNLTSGDAVERVGAALVDGNFFATLQSSPELGHAISAEDDQPGHDRVVVISHSLWQSMFGASATVLTQSLLLDGKSYRIIGVMPQAFQYPHSSDLPYGNASIRNTQVWVPLALTPQQKAEREAASGNVIARLKLGVTLPEAQAEMRSIMSHLDLLHRADMRGWGALIERLDDNAVGPVRPLMALLFGAVSFVLLIACANAANLLLAKAAGRTHELGIRATLGAGRGRVIRQLLTESLMLGLAAGIVGVVMAYGFLHILQRLNPGDIPRMAEASIDPRVLLFALLITILTSILFGIFPAMSVSRINLTEFLKSGGRGVVGAHNRMRNALIVIQIGLVFMLLTGAGLLLRSYVNVQKIQAGFAQSTVTMSARLDERYAKSQQRLTFFRTLFDKLAAIPGVKAVGAVNHLPLTNSETLTNFWVEGYANEKDQLVETRYATPEYFSAMNIPLVAGRFFTDSDTLGHTRVVVVNRAFAKKYLPKDEAIGRRIRIGQQNSPPVTVVGVLADARSLTLEDAPPPQVFSSFWQSDPQSVSIALRSELPPEDVVSTVRSTLKTIDPNLAIADIHTMGDLVTEATARRRFQTTLLTAFAAVALLLALIGFYGLVAYSVKQRTAEIGVRMALGASRRQVLTMVLRGGMRLVIIGLVFGLAGALTLTRILASFLYNVRPIDPLTFITVPILLLLVTIAACAIPSWRAAEVDPIQALRCD